MLKLTFHSFKLLLLFTSFIIIQEGRAKSDIYLITIGPGDAFWSAYGHTALAIDDRVYGFGYFSFEDEGLIKAFIENQMFYDIGVSEFQQELDLAEWQNRTFIVQKLFLSNDQKQQIIDYLEWHNLPENQAYRYDYFINNCATKIRDVIDDAWQGTLQKSFNKQTGESYFTQTFPAKNQALMNFGIVLGYGWPAYTERTSWELMAFPVYLQSAISELSNHKISAAHTVFQAESSSLLSYLVKTHWFLWTYVLVLFLGLKIQFTQKVTIGFLTWSQVFLGVLILYFGLFSGHDITRWNFNVLLFTPLVLLLNLSDKFKWLILISYVSWMVMALVLMAWYFIPICLLHFYFLYLKTNRQVF